MSNKQLISRQLKALSLSFFLVFSTPVSSILAVGEDDLVTGTFLWQVDPLNPGNSGNAGNWGDVIGQMVRFMTFQTPGGVISLLLPLLFTIAGLILFVMILWGGFEMLSGAATPKSQEAGKQRITAALTGFILLFASFWIAQIVQFIFGINIL